MLVDYMHSISPPFSSVLEIGCGFRRIIKLVLSQFSNIQKYIAIDISPDQIKNTGEYMRGISDCVDIEFIVSDIKSLQVMEHYDLVITAEVLLHVLPSEITDIVSKLVGFSSLHNTKTYTDSLDKLKRLLISPITKKGLVFKHDTKQSIFHAIIKNFTLIRGQGDGTDQIL